MDRNSGLANILVVGAKSLSARRAWIEILSLLRSVIFMASLSARRAWIEIITSQGSIRVMDVALRKESVDRNRVAVISSVPSICRSPQGERG